jgi:hypothetical protein
MTESEELSREYCNTLLHFINIYII